MKTKTMTAFLILAATAVTTAACFRSYGHRRYPGTPRFASNDPPMSSFSGASPAVIMSGWARFGSGPNLGWTVMKSNSFSGKRPLGWAATR